MPDKVEVIVEWRGMDRPSVIWRGKRSYEQWLTTDVTDQMGMCRYTVFYGELVGGVWHIGKACNARIQSKSPSKQVSARPLGSPPSRRQSY